MHAEFPTSTPNVTKAIEIVKTIEEHINAKITDVIASGDNGIVSKCNNGTVLKFTIDKYEAILWHKIKRNKSQNLHGIVNVHWVAQLFSSSQKDSIIYAVNVDYVANDLTSRQVKLIRTATKNAYDSYSNHSGDSRNSYVYNRTLKLVKEFQKLADVDDKFKYIPELIIDLADKYDSYIYDLHPMNFKVNSEGMVVLIDPSIPDIYGVDENVHKLVYEDISKFDISCCVVLY